MHCGSNALCIAFDFCFLNGSHTCRLRSGHTVPSNTATQCGLYEMTAKKDCSGGFFITSQRICKKILSDFALRKPTKQSSTFAIHTAEYAVNGNYGTDLMIDQCTSTDTNDINPWWMVDLQTVCYITSVRIVNIGPDSTGIDSSHRLRDVTVTVGMTESSVNIVCGFFAGPGTLSQVVIIDCPTIPEGRFVKISKTTEYLTLCEVDVFGVAV
nr:fucolectin-1-like [Crassostrea gigas]